jgi:hypothetical protein
MIYLLMAALAFGADDAVPTLEIAKGADQAKFGIGLQLGEPAGLNFKAQLDARHNVQGSLSWSLFNRLGLTADYLYTVAAIETNANDFDLPVYVGGRASVMFDSDGWFPWVGAGVPVGLAIRSTEWPLDAFIEVAPVVYVLPDLAFSAQGAIGLRGWFVSKPR